jgi:phospholipid-binding lipoprotein MlaA
MTTTSSTNRNTAMAGRGARLAGLLLLALALGGCAAMPKPNPRDPLEPMNRGVSQFNEGVDSVVLRPVATVYRQAVPPLVRTGVANFFGNISDAWSFVNSALQFKFHDAAENFLRFNVNTFFGLAGILDIASDMNIERHREDFGQTLGRWGVPAGPYIVLPFFGPSTLRDTLALPIDRRLDLVQRIDAHGWRNTAYTLRAVDQRSNLLRASSVLDGAALDKYSFTRDAHLQRRRAEIFEKEEPPAPPVQPGESAEPGPGAQRATPGGARPAAPAPGQPPAAPAR